MLLYSHLQFITSPWRGEADADAEGIGRGGEPLTIKYHPTPAAFAADPPPSRGGFNSGRFGGFNETIFCDCDAHRRADY